MESLKIILFSIFAAILFGIIHDQITVRVCLEYFTIGHPPVFKTTNPTLLGLGWGIIATWWVGLILGVLLAISAQKGKKPKIPLVQIRPQIFKLLGFMALFSLISGIIGYFLAQNHLVFLVEPMYSRVPKEQHILFIADLWAHSASYLVGFLGGMIITFKTSRLRSKLAQTQ